MVTNQASARVCQERRVLVDVVTAENKSDARGYQKKEKKRRVQGEVMRVNTIFFFKLVQGVFKKDEFKVRLYDSEKPVWCKGSPRKTSSR